MKLTPKMLVLMTALSAGVASAAPSANTTNTNAGADIKNIATASFTDPASQTTKTVDSNEVTTKVLPLPGFDITYYDDTADANTLATAPATKTVANATPGQVTKTDYAVVNNGNTALTVQLTANISGSASGATVTYLDASGNALPSSTSNGVTTYTVALPQGSAGLVKITQVITLPADAPANTVYGASPEGVVVGTGTASGQNGVPTGSSLYEGQSVTTTNGTTTVNSTPAQGADLQYVKVTTFQPTLSATPNNPATPKPTAPDGTTTATPPALSTVQIPTVSAGTANTPSPTNSVQGYLSTPSNTGDPTSGGTPIVPDLSGNQQIAYPKADADNNPATPSTSGQTNDQPGTADVITFTNDVKNTGTVSDTVQIYPAGPDGKLLSGTSFDASTGTFTLADGTKVIFLGTNTGAAIPVGTGATYPTLTVPAGGSAVFRTQIITPDANDNALTNAINIIVGADSLNDAGIVADTTTLDIILPAAAQFGDTTAALGAMPTPAPVQQVTAGAGTATSIDTNNTTDNVAVFSMDVANMGQYNDSYALSATVPGLPSGATITYVDASGTALPVSGGKFITPVVAAGKEIVVYAVVTVPAGATAGDYKISQTAVGNYSTITMTDLNDVIRVGAAGNVVTAKFVKDNKTAAGATPVNGIANPANYTANNTTVLPKDDIVYQIISKNNYNTSVANFSLQDKVPANTTFKSAVLTVNGAAVKTIYKTGGTWSATAPAAGTAAGTTVEVAADANSDNVPDALSTGSTTELVFTVTVN